MTSVPVRCDNCHYIAHLERHEDPNGWITRCTHCGYQEFKGDNIQQNGPTFHWL